MKLNILHFSDLHYEEKYSDKLDLLREQMISTIQSKNIEINTIVFSGDLVQVPRQESFENAYKNFILPIVDNCNTTIDNLCLTIGNHDVNLTKRNKLNFSGLKDYVISKKDKAITKDLIEDKIEMLEFDEFKNFIKERNFKSLHEHTTHYSIYKYNVGNGNILGIVSLNSSIFMEGSSKDYGNMYFVSDILLNAAQKISDCTIKAVNIHHSFGWFKNPKDLEKILLEKFNLVFFGHEHEHDGKYILDFNNRDIISFHAPSVFQTNNPKNGFSIYSFDIDSESVIIHNYIYNDRDKIFEEIESKEIENINIVSKASKAIRNLSICTQMYPTVKEKINNYLTINLTSEENQKDIDDIYVCQTIIEKKEDNNAEDDNVVYTLDDIIAFDKNILIEGKSESGKSTNLNMITLLCLKKYTELIPIYIASSELMNVISIRQFNALVSDYLDKNYGKNKFKIENMMKEKRFLFLIDDIDLLSHTLFEEIIETSNKIIASKTIDTKNMQNIIDKDISSLQKSKKDIFSSFLQLELKIFRKKDRKSLALKIVDSEKSLKISNSVHKTIVNLRLPSTPFITTLLIWMHTQKIDMRNNKPEIIDVFLDFLLEKTELSKQFKGKFNFLDKKELLSNIAYEFFKEQTFAIKQDKILQCIINYIDDYGFDINSSEVLDYFFRRKVFLKNNDKVMFSYRVFYYYFMSIYMIRNRSFTIEVMSSKKLLLNMSEELKFYAAMKTDDNEFVEKLVSLLDKSTYQKRVIKYNIVKTKLESITKPIKVIVTNNKGMNNSVEVKEPEEDQILSTLIDDKKTDMHEKNIEQYNYDDIDNNFIYNKKYYKEEFLALNMILSEFVKNLSTIKKEDKYNYLDIAIDNYANYFRFWEMQFRNKKLLERHILFNYDSSKIKLTNEEIDKTTELIKMHTLSLVTDITEDTLSSPKLTKIYNKNISNEKDLHKFFLYCVIKSSIDESDLENSLNELIHQNTNENIFKLLYSTLLYNFLDNDYASKIKQVVKKILIDLLIINMHGKKAISNRKIYNAYFPEAKKKFEENLRISKLLI